MVDEKRVYSGRAATVQLIAFIPLIVSFAVVIACSMSPLLGSVVASTIFCIIVLAFLLLFPRGFKMLTTGASTSGGDNAFVEAIVSISVASVLTVLLWPLSIPVMLSSLAGIQWLSIVASLFLWGLLEILVGIIIRQDQRKAQSSSGGY